MARPHRQRKLWKISRFEQVQEFAGHSARFTDVRDDWYGITLGYRPAKNIGIGFSPFLSVRSLKSASESLRGDVLANVSQNASTSIQRDYSFTLYSLLMKIGIYYEGKPFSLGLAVTTPSVRVTGTGSFRGSATVFNQDRDGDGELEAILHVTDPQDSKARYKTPLAISVGASWKADTRTIYFSAEWYNKVAPFSPIDAQPPTTFVREDDLADNLLIETNRVINFALGLEQRLSSKSLLFFSALTDLSAIAKSNDVLISMADRDLFHVTAGTSVTISRLTLTTGLGYVYGTEQTDVPINFLNPHESNYLLGEPAFEDVEYRGLKIIIGLELAPAQ